MSAPANPQVNFLKEDVLLNRLASMARSGKKLVFVVGSPLTAPAGPNEPGVPDVKGMLELIEGVYADDDEARGTLKSALENHPPNIYQAAFEHLQSYRGQDAVNQVIAQAVMRSFKPNRPNYSSVDILDDEDCQRLERVLDQWHFRPGIDALGEIIASLPDTFGNTVLTSNFDPLIELSIKRKGGKAFRTVLHSDGSLDQTVGADGCRVVHFHGYWYGSDTLHTPIQLGQTRPRLEASLRELLRSRTILVLAYGGWDDIFTSTMLKVVQDDITKPDVLWAFYGDDEATIQHHNAGLIRNLLPGISRGRVSLCKGIDVHSFLPKLKQKLDQNILSNRAKSKGVLPENQVAGLSVVQDPSRHEAFVNKVSNLFEISGHKSRTGVDVGNTRIDVLAEEQHGLVRKSILAVCTSSAEPTPSAQMSQDVKRLQAAQRNLNGVSAVLMHVSQAGHTADAQAYAKSKNVELFTAEELAHRLINFDGYIKAVRKDPSRQMILREYQQTTIHYEGDKKKVPALEFLTHWVAGSQRWLTILGDYGVGKSWTLKRLLYSLVEDYHTNPLEKPLPLFVPLQQFTKAFDFQNLILAVFQKYGITGVHYPAFVHLASQGRILFLFDSFDEMAQTLRREIIRENLKELLSGVTAGSKAIMTSRPTYFESRAERLGQDSQLVLHQADQLLLEHQNALSRTIDEQLNSSRFARLNDLTNDQRLRLFHIVLKDKPKAHEKLLDLHKRFTELDSISQRAVIARLLTTVAETLADEAATQTPDGYDLLPNQVTELNQAKVFQIIVTNLLRRDHQIGHLNAVDRQRFLRSFAIYLQQPGRTFFATPEEVRALVEKLFEKHLRSSDTPQQLLENFYRTCRRHSGLTTEGQFLDTSGNIDTPVDERDFESRVGFSHNSLREFLVADAIADYFLKGTDYPGLFLTTITPVVGALLVEISTYEKDLSNIIETAYQKASDSKMREWLFHIVYSFVSKRQKQYRAMLGSPSIVKDVDVCAMDLSGFDFSGGAIQGCIAADTDFRGANLEGSSFSGTIIANAMFDNAKLSGTDFEAADVQSIYVFDEYVRRTSAILEGRDARQWLYSRGAKVSEQNKLNPYLGQPWYEAAREVTRTLAHKLAGTHQDVGLVKGTKLAYRDFATKFVDFLHSRGVLKRIMKAGVNDGWVVKVTPQYRKTITDFSEEGKIDETLKPFFDKQLKKMAGGSSAHDEQ